MGLGAIFVNQLVKWDAQLQEDLDKMLEKAKAANERRYFGTHTLSLSTTLFSVYFILGFSNPFSVSVAITDSLKYLF